MIYLWHSQITISGLFTAKPGHFLNFLDISKCYYHKRGGMLLLERWVGKSGASIILVVLECQHGFAAEVGPYSFRGIWFLCENLRKENFLRVSSTSKVPSSLTIYGIGWLKTIDYYSHCIDENDLHYLTWNFRCKTHRVKIIQKIFQQALLLHLDPQDHDQLNLLRNNYAWWPEHLQHRSPMECDNLQRCTSSSWPLFAVQTAQPKHVMWLSIAGLLLMFQHYQSNIYGRL